MNTADDSRRPATAEEQALRFRLEQRAQRLARLPLLSPETSVALRAQLALEARRSILRQRRRFRALMLVGSLAALFLIVFALKRVPERADFGKAEVQVALLDPSGRVVSDADGLRSEGSAGARSMSSCYVEVVADEGSTQPVYISVRVEVDGQWDPGWNRDGLRLDPGAEFLNQRPWLAGELLVVVLASERPVPMERLDESLAQVGWQGLEEELGCRVFTRRISREPRSE